MPRMCEWLDGTRGNYTRCCEPAVRNENGRQLSWCMTHAGMALRKTAPISAGAFSNAWKYGEGMNAHITDRRYAHIKRADNEAIKSAKDCGVRFGKEDC